LGLNVDGIGNILKDVEVVSVQEESHSGTWEPVYGEKNRYDDNFNALTIKFGQKENRQAPALVFRAYNQGVAFKYGINGNADHEISIKHTW
jgi:alpha-glucosidase